MKHARAVVVFFALLVSAPGASGQVPEDVSAAMDEVYERFVRAYSMADPDSVVVLYADDPLYLPGQGPVVVGKAALRTQFGFLDAIRQRSASARISFESVRRGASGEVAWDVGYYTVAVEERDGRRSPATRGKFATVWVREEGLGWRIRVDSFSPAP